MADAAVPLDRALDGVAAPTRRDGERDGADGHLWNGVPTLVLTTTGRRSGQPRRNALIDGRDGEGHWIVASRGGDDHDPLWYRKLVADPHVGVPVGADRFDATARTASAEERRRWWPTTAAIWPAYDDDQAKTDRDVPVVVLTRQ